MVSDLKTFAHKGCKIAAPKKPGFCGEFCLTSRIFVGIGATIRIGREMLCLPYAGFFFSFYVCCGENTNQKNNFGYNYLFN